MYRNIFITLFSLRNSRKLYDRLSSWKFGTFMFFFRLRSKNQPKWSKKNKSNWPTDFRAGISLTRSEDIAIFPNLTVKRPWIFSPPFLRFIFHELKIWKLKNKRNHISSSEQIFKPKSELKNTNEFHQTISIQSKMAIHVNALTPSRLNQMG